MPPSSESIKEQILDDILTTLQGINGGATYFNTVTAGNVRRLDMAPPTIGTSPTILVAPTGTTYDNPRSGVLRTVAGSLRVEIACIIRTATDVAKKVERIIHDVHTALFVDITRSGLAINTRVVADDVWYPTDESEPLCGANIIVVVDYRALRTDLTSNST